MNLAVQQTLDIDVETTSQREKYLISLLREFRTIDAEIWRLEQLARGDGLIHEPSITVAPQPEDRLDIVMDLRLGKLNDEQREIVDTMQKYVETERATYATSSRVLSVLSSIEAETEEEQHTLEMFMGILRSRIGEESVELTSTERLTILREPEILRARQSLKRLHRHKVAVGSALQIMQKYYPGLYNLLWNRYVHEKGWIEVCEILGTNGASLTEKEYRNRRKSALQMFDRFCILHNEK